ncbi:MAG: 3-hydroxyisobutyrate dehydrogenase [Candidatus Rokubacteria bacterium]|nr:3-hydroxyisobutyrate dehydrogenase [Candidatus Rokubacteria bacterium]
MKRIGFIGVGTMGTPMVANLIRAGFSVLAYDVRAEALEEATRRGAAVGRSSAEVAKDSDLVVTMLPSSADVEACYCGPDGVLAGAPPGRLCVDMSTIDPGTSRRVAERAKAQGVRFLDAPVSGAVPRAVEGTLTIMVGGDPADLEEARPVLSAMGSTIIHVGPVGTGEVAKLCNNLIAGVAMIAVCEAFRLAEGFAVDPKVLTEVIQKSSGHTWVMEHNHPVAGMVAKAASSREYAPGFMTDLMAKDLGLVVMAGREQRVPLFVASAAAQLYRLASAHGLGRKDFSSVYTFLKPASETAPV